MQEVFPNAELVFDRFHVMKPVNEELNLLRKQTGMTVKGSKFTLLKNGVDLTEAERIRLASILEHSKRLKLAYELKEEFREIFETCHTVESGKTQLLLWLKKARSVYCNVLTTSAIIWMASVITSVVVQPAELWRELTIGSS